jgi:elongation factor 1-gamma
LLDQANSTVTSQNEKTTLLGKTKQDYASILKWMSFSNSHVLPQLSSWFKGLIGREPYNKKTVDTAQQQTLKALDVYEKHLLANTFLVGERLTLADLYCVSQLTRGFEYVFDAKFRDQYPGVTRWHQTVFHQPIYSAVAGEYHAIDEAVKYTPPKKEAAPKKEVAPKAEKPKPKPKEVEEEKDEPVVTEKVKHPLEALPKPTLVLDDWKRKYSNEDTRGAALPWFWEHYDPKDYSLWRVDYKYNEELTQVFMTSNLIGGFFNRLEASRKYLFGSCSVFGVANNSAVCGAFMVRGNEATPAFDVAPDFESYSFTKLDPSKAKDKEFIEDMWAWDKPIEVGGKEMPWADGKVFK